ncbi:amidohydrolase [Kineococcus rubinsiae]|uniref:amidohydrolase n=1 Tax=Kineococcus rubinsiae TaxID=2609562 RepID=UPI001432214B|nr:amidohydrolase family protein [Kineococcus rubinsiae]NIZ92336.1 amidohydrolase family protein [Kineococcus rubinsiae]
MTEAPDVLLRDVVLDGAHRDVLLSGGRVAAVGDRLSAGTVAGGVVVDAGGAVLRPGLRDEHVHLTQWATARRRVDVSAAGSARHVAELLAQAAPAVDGLLVGHGFRDALWAEPPHRELLDAALPGRPVVVVSQDLHTVWVNSAAAQRFGVTEPSGVLVEGPAMDLIAAAGDVEADVLDGWVLAATDAAAARGVTGVVDLEYAPPGDWVRRTATRPPGVRVRVGIWPEFLPGVVEAGLRSGDPLPGLLDPLTRDRLRTGPLKLFVDGSLGTRTAFCHDPYPDVEGPSAAGAAPRHGLLRLSPQELRQQLRRAHDAGLDLAVHAIGDAAVTVALDAFEAEGVGGRIEHAQQVGPADVPRFAALGVVASVQPRHAVDDRDACDVHWAAGVDRAFPYAALLAAGAEVVLGSDAPVAPLDPWDAVASAVHRSLDARPAWHPEQHLSLDDALAAASGGRRGVRVGEVADLVLLARDPAAVLADGGPDALRRSEVLATLVGGAFTHRAGV